MRKLIISNAYIYLVLPRTEVAEADEILRTGHTHAQQTRAHSATHTHTQTHVWAVGGRVNADHCIGHRKVFV